MPQNQSLTFTPENFIPTRVVDVLLKPFSTGMAQWQPQRVINVVLFEECTFAQAHCTSLNAKKKNKQQNKQITIPKSKQKLKFNWKFYTLNRRHSLVCHHGQLPKITRFNQFKQSKKLWEKKHRSFNGIRSKSFKWIIMQLRMFSDGQTDRHTDKTGH